MPLMLRYDAITPIDDAADDAAMPPL